MNNFYLIDKPLGITSFDVIRELRKKLQIKKMGHTGTLDPLASGALLVATGNYTKLIPYFEKDFKEYEFEIMLNGESDSYDLGTEVRLLNDDKINYFKNNLSLDNIREVIQNNFTGTIFQVPPKYSALKIGGKKALNKVLDGEDFELKKREALIKEINIVSFDYPSIKLVATVSAGTYIRSIAHDLGVLLGTGGYIKTLRRTKIGDLDISNSIKLDSIIINNSLSEDLLFGKNNMINLDKGLLTRMNDGLVQYKQLDLVKNKNLFVVNGERKITNIVKYDGEKLIPIKKI